MQNTADDAWKELEKQFHAGTKIHYRKGEIVIRPEEIPHGVHYLEQGFLKAYTITRNGQENIRDFKVAGSIFPLVWAITGRQHIAYFEAISDVVIYRLDRKAFIKYVRNNPDVMFSFLNQLIWAYEFYADRINNLCYRYARERIAYRLMTLAQHFSTKHGTHRTIDIPIRQSELADSVNVTRETASRELRRLRNKDVIEYKDAVYTIKDIESLIKEL